MPSKTKCGHLFIFCSLSEAQIFHQKLSTHATHTRARAQQDRAYSFCCCSFVCWLLLLFARSVRCSLQAINFFLCVIVQQATLARRNIHSHTKSGLATADIHNNNKNNNDTVRIRQGLHLTLLQFILLCNNILFPSIFVLFFYMHDYN